MLLENKTVLITGGAGFIGSHLVDRCLKEGAKSVIALDNLSGCGNLKKGKLERLESALTYDNFKFVEGDVRDENLVRKLIKESDYVFHEAAAKLVHSLKNPKRDVETNVLGTVNILEATRDDDIKIIHASTGSVLGSSEDGTPMKEDHPLRPTTIYGISKGVVERYIDFYAKIYGADVRILRYFHIFGPREDPGGEVGVISIFLNKIRNEENLTVFGGEQLRCFTYVEDVVAANMLMIEKEIETRGQIYNVASKTRISIKELAEKLITKYNPNLGIDYKPTRIGENLYPIPDTSKIEKLGFKEATTFEEGIEKTKQWIESTY